MIGNTHDTPADNRTPLWGVYFRARHRGADHMVGRCTSDRQWSGQQAVKGTTR